jgi:hypothetical protein
MAVVDSVTDKDEAAIAQALRSCCSHIDDNPPFRVCSQNGGVGVVLPVADAIFRAGNGRAVGARGRMDAASITAEIGGVCPSRLVHHWNCGSSSEQIVSVSGIPGVLALSRRFIGHLGGRASHMVSRILGSRPMVFLGLISYSLYLWHWPLIAYLNYMNLAIHFWHGLAVVGGSILLAVLSWRFIEIPMRRDGERPLLRRTFTRRLIVPALAITSIAATTSYANGFAMRFGPEVARLESILNSRPDVLRSSCHVPTALYATPPDGNCRLGVSRPELDGVLVGDSYANHFTGMVDVMAKAAGISLMDYTMDGCPPLLNYDNGAASAYAERCRKRNEAVYSMISSGRFSRVILAANCPDSPVAGEKLISSIEVILKAGATPDAHHEESIHSAREQLPRTATHVRIR